MGVTETLRRTGAGLARQPLLGRTAGTGFPRAHFWLKRTSRATTGRPLDARPAPVEGDYDGGDHGDRERRSTADTPGLSEEASGVAPGVGSAAARAVRRRAPRCDESCEMTVRSTKTRTAALSVSVRSQPLPWYGNRRIVRSISARRLPMVVRRSITISRNCSQKSGSTLIDVYRPFSQTLWMFGDLSPLVIGIRLAHAPETRITRRRGSRYQRHD